MNVVACPHCGTKRIVARVPKDWVAILKCPNCNELVVLFRGKVIGVDRDTLEHGSFEDRKSHIAEVIAEFLEPGMFGIESDEKEPASQEQEGEELVVEAAEVDGGDSRPISKREMDRFIRFDLQRIDEETYFKRHFT